MIKKLRTIIYHAADLRGAKAWYTRVTDVKPYFDENFYVGFDINGSELGIDPDMTNVTPGNQTVAYWAVDDINVASTHFISNGATLVQPVMEVAEKIKTAIVADPYGNHIGLIEEG